MLANVLDTPVPELSMSNNVDVCKDLFDTGALENIVSLPE